MLRAAILTVVLSLVGAPSMVAWCLSVCAPGATAAAKAAAGHCDLHGAPEADNLRVVAGESSHCGTPHESKASLLPGKLAQKALADIVLTPTAALVAPPASTTRRDRAAIALGTASPAGSFLPPLRI